MQMKIYTIFSFADGNFSQDEQNRLNTLCKELEIDESEKKEILKVCGGLKIKPNADNSAVIIQELTKLQMSINGRSAFGQSGQNKIVQAQTIWTLINLGYADAEFSSPEKRVIDHLAGIWDVSAVFVQNSIDIAETILLLTQKKGWWKTTNRPFDEINAKIQKIDQDIQHLFDMAEVLVAEADSIG